MNTMKIRKEFLFLKRKNLVINTNVSKDEMKVKEKKGNLQVTLCGIVFHSIFVVLEINEEILAGKWQDFRWKVNCHCFCFGDKF